MAEVDVDQATTFLSQEQSQILSNLDIEGKTWTNQRND